MSIAFHRKITALEEELIIIKRTERKVKLELFLKDVSGFADHHERATYGLGYKLTLQRTSDNNVLGHEPRAHADNRAIQGTFIKNVIRFVPRYTPNASTKTIVRANFIWTSNRIMI